MKLIKRCYGCGKLLYPWQDTADTKLVGKIHKGCAFDAITNYENDKAIQRFHQRLEERALKQLNEGEINEITKAMHPMQ